jgi:hypothetical protein
MYNLKLLPIIDANRKIKKLSFKNPAVNTNTLYGIGDTAPINIKIKVP